MRKLITITALSALNIFAMASDSSTDTAAVFAQQCYNSTASFNGKDTSCYLFANPPTYW
jgi:hypothetical protein